MYKPEQLRFTKSHEWIAADGTVGISDHAQKEITDVVFVELPKAGAELSVHKSFGTVESVKAVSDLYAPVSGTVTEVNGDLSTAPEQINNDAHKAWMVKVALKNPNEVKDLLSATDYEKYIAEES